MSNRKDAEGSPGQRQLEIEARMRAMMYYSELRTRFDEVVRLREEANVKKTNMTTANCKKNKGSQV